MENMVLNYVVEIKENKRSSYDGRKKIDWILCSYRFPNGDEWRKAFEVKVGTGKENSTKVPARGTQKEIHSYQF